MRAFVIPAAGRTTKASPVHSVSRSSRSPSEGEDLLLICFVDDAGASP